MFSWSDIAVCESIILRNVGVPSYAIQGKEAVLSCDYDLEGQQLYAVKWYKNGLEFYRFLPSSAKATTIYARPGVNVDPGSVPTTPSLISIGVSVLQFAATFEHSEKCTI